MRLDLIRLEKIFTFDQNETISLKAMFYLNRFFLPSRRINKRNFCLFLIKWTKEEILSYHQALIVQLYCKCILKVPFFLVMYQVEHRVLLLYHHHHCLIKQPHLRNGVLAENVIGKILFSSLINSFKKSNKSINQISYIIIIDNSIFINCSWWFRFLINIDSNQINNTNKKENISLPNF